MVEWFVRHTKYYQDLEDDVANFTIEMSVKQNKIRNLERENKQLEERIAELEEAANQIIYEKQDIINDLMNKLEIKEKERRSAVGKLSSLKRKIKGGKDV